MLLSLCCSVVNMLYCYCVALLLFVSSYVLIVCTVPVPPGVNTIAVDKYININISIHLNISLLPKPGLLHGPYASGHPTKSPDAPLLSPIRATCPAHLILLNLVTQHIFAEENTSQSSSLCSFLQSLGTPCTPSTVHRLTPYEPVSNEWRCHEAAPH